MTDSTGSLRMNPPEGGATVRMYCTGLGDCFLLGFPAGDRICYVLIDCGTWKGTRDVKPWMQRIMGHIAEEVGEYGIDLLVVTHPHWDHLSGFSQARRIFDQINVKQVWLPWTEDPHDRTALKLAEERRMAFRAAVAAASELRTKLGPDEASGLETVLRFAGYSPGGLPDLLRVSTDDLMEIVRKKVDTPRYVRPSLEPLALGRSATVRIFALGPPTDPKLLGRDDPLTAPGKSEVYLAQRMLPNEETALYAAAAYGPVTEADRQQRDLAFPFDQWLCKDRNDPDYGPFFHSRYLDRSARAPAWRRIDCDWLEIANQLALNLDDHINNTSLVLAFELGENGPVLLFPGDAQVGNWLSWHELKSVNGVTAESLLNRTVLYKVGHHGSHNATLKDKGLNMMTDTTRLVAMIPVDQAEAEKPKGRNEKGWAMPYDKLLAELEIRTEGRVLRADKRSPVPPQDLDVRQKKRWAQFEEGLKTESVPHGNKDRRLFIQYTFDPSRSGA